MTEPASDRTVQDLRTEIADVDHTILDAVNTRLELVARLKAHKATLGAPFVDPEQERRLLARLEQVNRGPLTRDGLHRLYERILELTKRELAD
jgi:chorismate mutase